MTLFLIAVLVTLYSHTHTHMQDDSSEKNKTFVGDEHWNEEFLSQCENPSIVDEGNE